MFVTFYHAQFILQFSRFLFLRFGPSLISLHIKLGFIAIILLMPSLPYIFILHLYIIVYHIQYVYTYSLLSLGLLLLLLLYRYIDRHDIDHICSHILIGNVYDFIALSYVFCVNNCFKLLILFGLGFIAAVLVPCFIHVHSSFIYIYFFNHLLYIYIYIIYHI